MNVAGNPIQIESRHQLVEYLESGCKPESEWRLGTEHEKFGFTVNDLRPLPYEGKSSIKAMLEGIAKQFGWKPVEEQGKVIALLDDNGASITLEPGGQLELSGALLDNVHQTCDEVYTHLKQVKTIAEPLGIAFLGMGFQPKWERKDTEWMPKGRYRIMREYMDKRGNLGQDMMSRTCTVQVNLGSRHGEKIPGGAGPATGCHCLVREFTFCRWQAVRVCQLPFPCLGGYRPRSNRNAALCLRIINGF